MEKRKMLFVLNPYAGRGQIKNKLLHILDIFIKAGYSTEVYITQGNKDAITQVAAKGAQVDLIVASGGDGTLNEIVCGLMQIPSDQRPDLGYIPAGTTNDYSRTLKIPKDMYKAAQMVVDDEALETDIGVFNDKYFTYVAGFGAFTEISYVTPQDTKNVLGHQAYIYEGIKRLADIKPKHVKVIYDEGELEDDFLIGLVTNSISVAGMLMIAGRDVSLDDGLFEVILIRNPANPLVLTKMLAELLQDKEDSMNIIRFKTSKIVFEAQESIDWVLDGEFGGTLTKVEISVCHGKLKIIRKNVDKQK